MAISPDNWSNREVIKVMQCTWFQALWEAFTRTDSRRLDVLVASAANPVIKERRKYRKGRL